MPASRGTTPAIAPHPHPHPQPHPLPYSHPLLLSTSTKSLLDAIERVIHPISIARDDLVAATLNASNNKATALTYIQVIVSLATLQSAVSDLSRAYINHANTVLNRGPSTLDLGGITSSLLENGLFSGARGLSPGGGVAGVAGGVRGPGGDLTAGGKKKRKRAPHDPNAPKRALTPYFLYMQHNRASIAEELGENARPKEVADEGTRRWAEMPDEEKQIWKKLYADNLAIYHEKMRAYKAGLPVPEDDVAATTAATNANAAAAMQLQQGVHRAAVGEEEASSEESEAESEEDEEEEEEESSPEPVRAPTPPRSTKRRRTTGGGADAKPAATPVAASAKKASPEKKVRGAAAANKKEKEKEEVTASGKPKRGAAAAAAAAAANETPKSEKKGGKKKGRKSEAGD
ncbi:hypothetical protein AJ78_02217 [Emergomyces pasteurianus Ep9510]|uniref:HMG box domain-containing protein n=1 Tax=Emergomyces pasteurianus Ep9510 TaxID=1447872 RepID=A0A1J9QP92_9EURO|nr:hypothetical protein AJ78_02217 [Emergomyces pasteurianus Ep9510]